MTDHERESGFTRGDLARATGCNIETIRYYEKTGLLPDPPRTAAGYRIYSAAHATRLRFILRARELGFSMEDIRGLLGLEDGSGADLRRGQGADGTPPCRYSHEDRGSPANRSRPRRNRIQVFARQGPGLSGARRNYAPIQKRRNHKQLVSGHSLNCRSNGDSGPRAKLPASNVNSSPVRIAPFPAAPQMSAS